MTTGKALRSDLAAAVQELPPILSLTEAANFMRLSTRTLRRLIAAGRLQATKGDPSRNGKVLVTRASVHRVLCGEG